jgi:hypothetical protein
MTTQSASSGWWARFTFNGITRYDQGAYDLVGGVAEGFCAAVELSDAGTWPKASVAEPLREDLSQLCRQRIDAFRMQRGEEVLAQVNWQPLRQTLVPQTFFELMQPLLPERHSPISTSSGRGNQGVYLAGLSELAVPTACCSPPMRTRCSNGTGSALIPAVS